MIAAAAAMVLADLPASVLPVPAPAAVGAAIVLPAGTAIQLVTVDALDSRTAKQGQRFALRVSEDVIVGPAIVIPRGTPAIGEVEAVSGKGMVGKAGRLELRPLFIELGGERIYLTGTTDQRGRDSTAGVAVGSLLFSGLGIFITGKSAAVPAGSLLPGRIRTDVTILQPVAQTGETAAPTSDTH